jgi:hypothetical protein
MILELNVFHSNCNIWIHDEMCVLSSCIQILQLEWKTFNSNIISAGQAYFLALLIAKDKHCKSTSFYFQLLLVAVWENEHRSLWITAVFSPSPWLIGKVKNPYKNKAASIGSMIADDQPEHDRSSVVCNVIWDNTDVCAATMLSS